MAAVLFITMVGAQTTTMKGFVVGSALSENGNNTYSVIGQTFAGQTSENGFEVSTGMAQMQLVRELINASVNYGEGYNANGFSYPPKTPVGTYENDLYLLQGANYHYDLAKHLKLVVMNVVSCGELVYDGDHNAYPTVMVAGHCWTQQNLRAAHYADGITAINKALVYKSLSHPNEADNEATYGRLYTWYSAVNVPEDGSEMPIPDADGHIQGICPNGWHIPTTVEMEDLRTVSAPELNATILWVGPYASQNTNTSGFTALPAGKYNVSLLRYEGLGTETDWWSDSGTYNPATHATTASVFVCAWYCEDLLIQTFHANDAVSVRCVKNE